MLDMFFKPTSVAIVGASENPAKLGNRILANVINGGYKGQIYPINPTNKRGGKELIPWLEFQLNPKTKMGA